MRVAVHSAGTRLHDEFHRHDRRNLQIPDEIAKHFKLVSKKVAQVSNL